MTRCDEFYEKVEKDGNFCGMRDNAYRDLMAYRDLLKSNDTIVSLSEGAALPLIREPNEEVKAKAIEVIAKQLKSGEKVTAKVVKEDLVNAGHKDKVVEERIYTEEDKIRLTEEYVNDMLNHGIQEDEILRRVKKAFILGSGKNGK